MNSFPNIPFLLKSAKHHISLNARLKYDSDKMQRYQTKALKKMIRYAQKTKLYTDKYKNENITSDDIKHIQDVEKLPFVTKQNLRDYKNEDGVPYDFNLNKAFKVDTSGSTGNPVSVYRDINSLALEFALTSRPIKMYGLNPSKAKITNIGDFSIPNSYDEECVINGFYNYLGFLSSYIMKNIQTIYAGLDIKTIMKKLNSFNPDYICAYPSTLIGLMLLKNEGYGENINPTCVASSGGVLDEYTKKQFENTFDTKIFDLYAATESGTVGFECPDGCYHVESDLLYIEAIDKNMEPVNAGESGHIVITRLYDGGTPFIRYTGMDDIVTLGTDSCSCGWSTQLLKKVGGRSSDSIVLPDGRVFPPATFTLIPGEVAQDTGVDIIQRFQIIQHKKDDIEIRVIINDTFRDAVKSIDSILNEIQSRYQQVVGKQVNIIVKEVDEIIAGSQSGESLSSIVISHVDHSDWL
jgi:phenylacetate-CoA ligase